MYRFIADAKMKYHEMVEGDRAYNLQNHYESKKKKPTATDFARAVQGSI